MAAPAGKMLVYDGNCPLCNWYTGVFAKHGILLPEQRRTFAMFSHEELQTMMQFPRAKHEVPLVDMDGGPTLYGVEALVYLLGHRFAVLHRVMRCRLAQGAANILYALVSYNRRFIAFSRPSACSFDCTPDYNRTYRLLFIALCMVLAAMIVLPFAAAFPGGTAGQVLLAGTALVAAMCVVPVFLLLPDVFREYISHCVVVVLLGSLPLGISGVCALAFNEAGWLVAGAICTALLTTWLYNIRLQRMGMGTAWLAVWIVPVVVLMGSVAIGIYGL